MDFDGMKRKDLQSLCKKHGILRTLKNCEMANRLPSVFQKETAVENKIPAEDSVEAHGIKDSVTVSGKGKKVTFSPETEVFEFTRSVKKRRRKNVRSGTQEPAQDLQQGGIRLRRSKGNVAKEIIVAGSNGVESNTRRECNWSDVKEEAHKVPRRSKRIGCEVTEFMALDQFKVKKISKSLSGQMEISKEDGFKLETVRRRSTRLAKSCVGDETSKEGSFSSANQSKQRLDTGDKEVELVKNNMKEEVSMEFKVQETRKYHRKDDPQVKKVLRRSKRFLNTTQGSETVNKA